MNPCFALANLQWIFHLPNSRWLIFAPGWAKPTRPRNWCNLYFISWKWYVLGNDLIDKFAWPQWGCCSLSLMGTCVDGTLTRYHSYVSTDSLTIIDGIPPILNKPPHVSRWESASQSLKLLSKSRGEIGAPVLTSFVRTRFPQVIIMWCNV